MRARRGPRLCAIRIWWAPKLRCAARHSAREQARRSAGYVVVYREGKIVEDWVGKRVA
jgi:hypothetical protein